MYPLKPYPTKGGVTLLFFADRLGGAGGQLLTLALESLQLILQFHP